MADDIPLSIYPDANRHYSFTDPLETPAMTDDTVEKAKQALIDETGAAAWERWLPKLDALIAAVRAEKDGPITVEQARRQLEFDIAHGLTGRTHAIDTLIAAVRDDRPQVLDLRDQDQLPPCKPDNPS
jgi:hypothetical protein